MIHTDYRGARGANAGDDFHELWALRQALTLLDHNNDLMAVTVEGLQAEDESGATRDTWDGVDCTLYYGGDRAATANRIVIVQLKYSAASPDQQWTIARLTQSNNTKQNNSVIRKLAKAFVGIKALRTDLVTANDVGVKLVSNQAVDPDVLEALSNQGLSNPSSNRLSNRVMLLNASGLANEDFDAFAKALDLSECGHASRFALEERLLVTISNWIEDDARIPLDHLMRFIRREMMMPESKGDFITWQSILVQLGFSDRGALFPCPSAINKIKQFIPREVSQRIVGQLISGNQRLSLHGVGGCGKTTLLQEVEKQLPSGSVVVQFDCYGGGRYLDSDAYRHQTKNAFLQLSNELASVLQSPLLVSQSANLDYPKVFKKRLERAGELVASMAHDALLLVVVDAADNSMIAAEKQSEKSFVQDFLLLGDLPQNVRLVVTTRTGQLPKLNLPHTFTQLEIQGFTLDETAQYVRTTWNEASDTWLEDFHHHSNGNPRVQRYALDYAGVEPMRALEYLRPQGKKLDQIFQEQMAHIRSKVGNTRDIKTFCSGLIALPRPIPLTDLAAVTHLTVAHIHDLCADLAPGIRLTNELIGFADEDFEHFIRAEAEIQLRPLQASIADHFLTRHLLDPYAATHLAAALLAAGRGREVIHLVATESEPKAIGDPILRREVHLQRLRLAMKVCRDTGNNVDAILTLLIGAEAFKTDAVIRRMLNENLDLAAAFARNTSSKTILRNSDEIEHHGPLLFHLMAADADQQDGISVREGQRQAQAWLQRRQAYYAEEKAKHPGVPPQGWSITIHEIAAEIEALLRIAGPRAAREALLHWSPKRIALAVVSILAYKLVVSGEVALIERCLAEAEIAAPWDLFVLTPLTLSGQTVDLVRLEISLGRLLRRGLIRVAHLRNTLGSDADVLAQQMDVIITACEAVIGRGGNSERIIPILEQIVERESRQRDRLSTSQVPYIDFSLRAFTLLERLAGRKPTLEGYWIEPSKPAPDLPAKEVERLKKADTEKQQELQEFIGPLVELYDVRAQALIGTLQPEEFQPQLQNAIAYYQQKNERSSGSHWTSAMRTRASISIARLMVLPRLDRTDLFKMAYSLLALSPDSLGFAEVEVLKSFAFDRSLHSQVLVTATARAKVIRSLRIASEEKITALMGIARLLLPISRADARGLFKDAFEVADEVNADAIHEIALFAPLASNAVDAMDNHSRRIVAHDLAVIVADTGIRLKGQGDFPWIRTAKALATLDAGFALAATARWEDTGLVGRSSLLPSVLETGLSSRDMSSVQVIALLPLLDHLSIDLGVHLVEAAKQQGMNVQLVAEELAQDELLRFGRGTRPQIYEKLKFLQSGKDSSFWIAQLELATAFHQTLEQSQPRSDNLVNRPQVDLGQSSDPLATLNRVARRYVSADEIDSVIVQALAVAQTASTYVSVSGILDHIRPLVAFGDRSAHLDALSRCKSSRISDYEIARAITRCIDAWWESPSIHLWCHERLLKVVVDLLPGFSHGLAYQYSPLPALLKKSGLPRDQICNALLEAVEHQVDALTASEMYALGGLVGQYCTSSDAMQVVTRYATRLIHRIPVTDRETWILADLPSKMEGSIARFLYALMGDVDVRIRWRAAHALRRLACLGDTHTLEQIVTLYEHTSETSYRDPEAPFYWLAARLWLVIALDRIASETPAILIPHAKWLLGIASDMTFPHLVIRGFAKSAVTNLLNNGVALDRTRQNVLKRANTSPLRRKKERRVHDDSRDFDRYTYQEIENRRFHFDSMDTLPYWYTSALRVFANLNKKTFLDSAERWIVECWGVQNSPWRWTDEPRSRHRLSDHSYQLMTHSHGSLPTIERFNTYLEWHAMWCAAGELMQTYALAEKDEEDYDRFENWLKYERLTSAPLWLADFHGIKPLEARLWVAPPGDVNAWVENVGDEDFLAELGLDNMAGRIVVNSYHETRSPKFMLSTKVETALVSPATARALVRALQTTKDSHNYRIPPASHDLEINSAPYELLGWLTDAYYELGIDAQDPLRYEVRAIKSLPSPQTIKMLNLQFLHNNHQASWQTLKNQQPVFLYEAWGDNRGDEQENDLRYDKTIRSNGWRLGIDREALRAFLNKSHFDLIVEVEITRKNEGYYDYSYNDKEKTKEVRFDRVLLFRRDGTLEAAEGCIGTWTTSRPRIGF